MSIKPGPLGKDPFEPAIRTPGPLGHNDPGDPFAELLGDTAGSLGVNDHAARLASAHPASSAHHRRKRADPLETAFLNAWALGWVPFFQAAAEANDFSTELLLAIAYRESRLNPKYLKTSGDKGHGYGLMQIDIRSYPKWVAGGKWKDANECIAKGAEILASKREQIKASVGKRVEVKDHAGRKYHFKGKPFTAKDLLRMTVAAYNCGMWSYYHYSHGHDIDRGTTGQDYSRDVLERTARFRKLLDSFVPRADPNFDLTAYV